MATRSWLKQETTTASSWFRRTILADEHEPFLTLDESELDHLLATSPKVFKDDRTTTVAFHQGDQHSYVIKRYNARNIGHSLKRALRRSRAMGCWQLSYEFQQAGLRVSPPILMLEKRFGPLCSDAYFVSHYLEGVELLKFLPHASASDRMNVAAQIETAFKKMRDYGLTHGDLKASNLLWVDEQLFFVDLDAARKHRTRISWNHSNRRDIKRFMKNWQDDPELLSLFDFL